MATTRQNLEQPQSPFFLQRRKISGNICLDALDRSPMTDDKEESAFAIFKATEDEIERRKMEVKDRVQKKLELAEESTRKLAEIREELDALTDPLKKEVSALRKRVDAINKELKPLGQSCQKKEREYKEALEAYDEKNKEKSLYVNKLLELVNESERLRMNKLEELSKNI